MSSELEQEQENIQRAMLGKTIVEVKFNLPDLKTASLEKIILSDGTVVTLTASDYDGLVMVEIE